MDAIRFLNVEYIYTRLVDLFWNFDVVAILNTIIHVIEYLIPVGIIISLFLIYVIFYSRMRLKQMADEDKEKKLAEKSVVIMSEKAPVSNMSGNDTGVNLPGAEVVTGVVVGASVATVVNNSGADLDLHTKWQLVQKSISSNNSADWRVAIMEADIMLGDILSKQGYVGDIGDQLKSVDPSDMLTLQDAWAAHRVRNRIAHDGSSFQVNEREARATIDLYKKVFEEFYHL